MKVTLALLAFAGLCSGTEIKNELTGQLMARMGVTAGLVPPSNIVNCTYIKSSISSQNSNGGTMAYSVAIVGAQGSADVLTEPIKQDPLNCTLTTYTNRNTSALVYVAYYWSGTDRYVGAYSLQSNGVTSSGNSTQSGSFPRTVLPVGGLNIGIGARDNGAVDRTLSIFTFLSIFALSQW
eukprot:CAMPEP_0203749944 /NCGR_PEP_ID=MMETSP0098-20131031/4295_1 /ASSEMBLY_ACC=CAM_ASM_000208 /TAXON_ID=96639 /ORGANISM=" , Strain NY0313808BC1" /LENGTH=179 /DNA_ID=CAMNT_0050639067 /DNA_START=63 /DNA_END=599 /DNA_ORIENTATION=+